MTTTFESGPRRIDRVRFFDDFLSPVDTAKKRGWEVIVGGTAGFTQSAANIAAAKKTIGVLVPYATTAASYAYIGTGFVHMAFGSALAQCSWKVSVPNLSTSSQEFSVVIGFTSNTGSNAADSSTSGAYFRYAREINGDRWVCVTRANSDADPTAPTNQTITVTGVAPSEVYQELQVMVNEDASVARFYIDGALVASHTTNIPADDSAELFGCGLNIAKRVGSTLRSVPVDYADCEFSADDRRVTASKSLFTVGDSFASSDTRSFAILSVPGYTAAKTGVGGRQMSAASALFDAAEPHDVCILEMGINDIAQNASLRTLQDRAEALIFATNAATKVICTVSPFGESTTYTAEREAIRRAYNAWLLGGNVKAHVFDLDAVLRDPANTVNLLSSYDNGDALHPNDTGHTAIKSALETFLTGLTGSV